ncbi:hypothetical protein HBN50_05350 [Halobacteriovorax sp. GB3]|uniref:hypothetical protein n=1 Tax=Halobacteriovorax sp. GB3 TaxID=2719615 RepID=UPI00235FB7D1|nr:hypothetical protein [Halobacteriovorax sp. GB3]MDD0852512.1 hypothetical protein [Halobacteriovorax sp. GB3]
MLKVIKEIIDNSDKANVKFCHWKSNNILEETVNGFGDVDLLVEKKCRADFEKVIFDLGFLPTKEPFYNESDEILHYYGIDKDSGKIVHLHVYYELITGGSILKNYNIPTNIIFENLKETSSFKIPLPEVELVLLVLRKYIEHISIVELRLLWYDYKNINKELNWLLERSDWSVVERLLNSYFPEFTLEHFQELTKRLVDNEPLTVRIKKGLAVYKHLNKYRIKNSLYIEALRFIFFALMIIKGRVFKGRSFRKISKNGMIVSFVGTEASGKTTLSNGLEKWVKSDFSYVRVHCGKPPATIFTSLFRRALPSLVKIKGLLNSFKKVDEKKDQEIKLKKLKENKPHPLICMSDAIDRYFLTKKLMKYKNKGFIVLTDRFPNKEVGMIDGPRIDAKAGLGKFLGKVESHFYNKIGTPNLIIKVSAPLDETLVRNSKRDNPEPEEFVRSRYELFQKIQFPQDVKILEVDTTNTVDDCMIKIKETFWDKAVELN